MIPRTFLHSHRSKAAFSKNKTRLGNSAHPTVERLEDRTVPTVSITSNYLGLDFAQSGGLFQYWRLHQTSHDAASIAGNVSWTGGEPAKQ